MPRRRLDLTVCTVDLDQRLVLRDGVQTRLSGRECDLLAYLADRPGTAVSREVLLTEVWGYAPGVRSRAVDATASRVRSKIERSRDDPDHLLTVHGSGYCFVATAVVAADPRTNVVARRGRFVGRDAVLDSLVSLVEERRCCTLVGPPGAGKTTLSQMLAQRLFQSGGWSAVWFVACASARCFEDVSSLVASTLKLAPGPGAPTLQVGHALCDMGRSLLVLDNLEQVLHTEPAPVLHWLDAAPELRIVVTSREPLGIGGERVVPVPPLAEAAGVRLLAQLAEDAGAPMASLSDTVVLRRITGRLDGLPLAIELAAARLRGLGPHRMLQRLDRRFTLLASRRRDQDGRQRTLRAALDWSWDLLVDSERRAWAQCGVFQGPFSWEAAEAVIAVSEPVLDVLQRLVDKSVLAVTPDGRVYLLESVAAYVRERLDELADTEALDREALHRRHVAWFAGSGPEDAPHTLPDRLRAIRCATDMGEPSLATAAIVSADRVLQRHGSRAPVAELAAAVLSPELDRADQAALQLVLAGDHQLAGRLDEADAAYRSAMTAAPAERADLRGQARLGLGQVAHRQGALDVAIEELEGAISDLEGVERGWAWARAGVARMRRGEVEAAQNAQEHALRLAEAASDEPLAAFAQANLVAVSLRQGRLSAGVRWGELAITAARRAGDRRMEAIAAGNLGALQATWGDLDRAAEHYERACELHRAAGNRPGACSMLANLGDLELTRGRSQRAERYLTEALTLARAVGARRQEGLALLNLGQVYLQAGRVDEARDAFDAAHDGFTSIGVPRLAAIAQSHAGAARAQAGEEAIVGLIEATRILDELGDGLQAALSRCRLARACWQAGDLTAARAALDDAQAAARRLGVGPDSALAGALRSTRSELG